MEIKEKMLLHVRFGGTTFPALVVNVRVGEFDAIIMLGGQRVVFPFFNSDVDWKA